MLAAGTLWPLVLLPAVPLSWDLALQAATSRHVRKLVVRARWNARRDPLDAAYDLAVALTRPGRAVDTRRLVHGLVGPGGGALVRPLLAHRDGGRRPPSAPAAVLAQLITSGDGSLIHDAQALLGHLLRNWDRPSSNDASYAADQLAASPHDAELHDTSVMDPAPLTSLGQLGLPADLATRRSLNLSKMPLTDLGPLAGLTELQWLYLRDTPVTDLGPLAGLTGLHWLDLSGTPVTDLGPLAGLINLWWLYLPGTPVTDLGPLAGLPCLAYLELDAAAVTDLTPLAEVPKLDTLNLVDTAVTDLAPLAGLPVRILRLPGTPVADLTPLSSLAALMWLDLRRTPATDLGPLRGLARTQVP